jgi:hypothetical protein
MYHLVCVGTGTNTVPHVHNDDPHKIIYKAVVRRILPWKRDTWQQWLDMHCIVLHSYFKVSCDVHVLTTCVSHVIEAHKILSFPPTVYQHVPALWDDVHSAWMPLLMSFNYRVEMGYWKTCYALLWCYTGHSEDFLGDECKCVGAGFRGCVPSSGHVFLLLYFTVYMSRFYGDTLWPIPPSISPKPLIHCIFYINRYFNK